MSSTAYRLASFTAVLGKGFSGIPLPSSLQHPGCQEMSVRTAWGLLTALKSVKGWQEANTNFESLLHLRCIREVLL